MGGKKNGRRGPRWYEFVRWSRGLAPGYRPTMADLWALDATNNPLT